MATNRHVLTFVSIVGVLALSACAAAPDGATDAPAADNNAFVEAAQIDAVVEHAMQEQGVPGVAVAVVRGGEVLLSKGYGSADLEHDVPVTPLTMFQSGSVGKMFTAAAVMVLVEDGLVDLDVPIRAYLWEAPEAWNDITLRHLLSHTSGIPDYEGPEELDYTRDYSEGELVEIATGLGLEFAPGDSWSYSNTGYVLLGIIVGRVAEKPYGDLLRERVWDPAGVPTMRVNVVTDIVPHRSAGYEREDGELHEQAWVAPSLSGTADGSLLMSLEDMIAWNEMVRNRAVLAAESWDEMLTPVTLNSGDPYPYGFGWAVTEIGGHPVHEHGGSWQGFRTVYTRVVDDDVAIIVLANAAHADPEAIARSIAGILDPSYVPPPDEPQGD